MARAELPIFAIERRLLEALERHRRAVVTAPTGSGKSTQVPQMLLDGGLLDGGQAIVLQPRRLATRLLAAWVARARRTRLGEEVGYQMRFENVTSRATRLCYATEGVLLRRMLEDPRLRGVGALVFDEFHERHLYGDVSLARALEIQETARPDLAIVVMSATLEAAALEKYLEPCAVLSCEGRAYPVTIEYLSKPAAGKPVWELAVEELKRAVRKHPRGDVLVFMPGAYEIARTVERAAEALGHEFVVLPLHGELPPRDQDAAVARYERRKVVVSTNVAETSLTIDGVELVIDSGLARIPRYDPHRGINTLRIAKISRASADQRAGRAGRTAPGRCVRLWTAHEHAARPARETPEVKRLDLSEVVLALKASGVGEVRSLRWLEAPDARLLERAERLLEDLGAIDPRSGAVTELGRRMAAFPAHPRYSRMLLAAQGYGCVREAALIAALTQGRDLFLRRRKGGERGEEFSPRAGTGSDFFPLMEAWRHGARHGYDPEICRRTGVNARAARQVGSFFEQLLGIAAAEGVEIRERPAPPESIQRCVLVGFSDQLARRRDAASLRCELVHGRRGVLARESVVRAPLFVASEAREIETGRDRELSVVLSLATAVEEAWLRELFPEDFAAEREAAYDERLRRVVVRERFRFRDLVLEERVSESAPPERAAAILAREVAAGRLVLKKWDEAVEQWILRVNRLRGWMPELGLPPIGEEERLAILERVCRGALSYREIEERPVLEIARSLLSRSQREAVERHAPERIDLPSGRSAKVVYAADGPPVIGARIQDLYGVEDRIWIADRRVALRIQVLAPSNRPVQITESLAAFWRETYPKLKPQLQRRYPKHEWR